ncbi:hypothetical protein B7P34_01885 [Streptosporangium nondiastaticum]|uniref:Uncharacterized protein n=1 Tax=Streptosporangium nondiastaticum TaxID=35764 RepID=A0A9X7JV71_9ACTN|nr:hypothetical protein B7P34_01885 [Streptosporangium nondiastaticum]
MPPAVPVPLGQGLPSEDYGGCRAFRARTTASPGRCADGSTARTSSTHPSSNRTPPPSALVASSRRRDASGPPARRGRSAVIRGPGRCRGPRRGQGSGRGRHGGPGAAAGPCASGSPRSIAGTASSPCRQVQATAQRPRPSPATTTPDARYRSPRCRPALRVAGSGDSASL